VFGPVPKNLGVTDADAPRRLYAGELGQPLHVAAIGRHAAEIAEHFAIAAQPRKLPLYWRFGGLHWHEEV
jgi:hypothetical protein